MTHEEMVNAYLGKDMYVVHNSRIRKEVCCSISTHTELAKDGPRVIIKIVLGNIGSFHSTQVFGSKEELKQRLIDTL